MKRKWLVLVLLATLFISAACTPSSETTGEDPNQDLTVAARVNGVDISMTSFNEAYAQNLSYYETSGTSIDEATQAQLRDQVLDKLIQNELLKQYAAQDTYEVLDEDVEGAYQWYVTQYETEENLLELLEQEGITPEAFRDDLRMQIDIDSYVNGYLINHDMLGEIEVSEADIQAAFEEVVAESDSNEIKLEDVYEYLRYNLQQEKVQNVINMITDILIQDSEIEYFINK